MKPMDPSRACIVLRTKTGKEIARIPATDPKAQEKIRTFEIYYGRIGVDYEEMGEDEATVAGCFR
jgi:hypothetical protein